MELGITIPFQKFLKVMQPSYGEGSSSSLPSDTLFGGRISMGAIDDHFALTGGRPVIIKTRGRNRGI